MAKLFHIKHIKNIQFSTRIHIVLSKIYVVDIADLLSSFDFNFSIYLKKN